MRQGLEGTFAVDKIACARVYHVNVVVRITKLSGGGPCCDAAASRMQMDRTRLILDHGGLLRLEALGELSSDERFEACSKSPLGD